MSFIKSIYTKILVFVSIIIPLTASAQSTDELKAMWIYNIAYGVDWPNEDTIQTFTIGVFSSSKAYEAILDLSKSRTIKGKPVKVIRFRNYNEIGNTNIIYVTKSENPFLDIVYERVKGKPILIFADRSTRPQFTVINFLPMDKGKKKFSITTKTAKRQNLVISKMVLKLGGSEDDLRELYNETERKLKIEHDKLNAQKKEIREKEKMLDEQEGKISKQRKNILEKQGIIASKDKEVSEKNKRLDSMSFEVLKQREKLMHNLAVLENQEKKLSKQHSEFKKQNIEMLIAAKKLKLKQDSIKEIDRKLGLSNETIQDKQGIIYMFIGVFILVFFLILVILNVIVKKQKINKKLNTQNIAINKQKEEIIAQSKQVALINSELEKLSIVASKTDNAVTIMDAAGNFEWVNAGFTRLYGYTLQLLINEKDQNILNASTNPEITKIIKSSISEKETKNYESKNITRNNDELWVQTTITPILDDENNVIKLISIDSNISSLKKAEREIREQHKMIIDQARELEKQNKELEMLSLVASETDNAILMTDSKGNFTWVNDAYVRMFGHNLEELTTKISKNIMGPKTDPHIKKLILNCIENKETVDYEFKTSAKNGNVIWVRTTLTPILNGNGKIKNLIAIDTDITKLKIAEFEILQKSEELLAQREELKIQNHKIEFQNKHIKSSIVYAKNIQQAILPLKSEIDSFLDSFIIFKPKDVVSGDFYWFAHLPEKDGYTEKIFLAAVDCTGHGVPGAFMSMIGSRLLNEIVMEQKIVSPKDILEALDVKVKKALKQENSDNNDGMDLCLLRLEKENERGTITAKFSGAKRPLYYYKADEKELMILPSDRRSIGGTQVKRTKISFSNQSFEVTKGDIVWLTTDGIIDQNNQNRKRMGTPKLISVLTDIATKPLEEQKQIILNQLNQHQEGEDQRDDITLIGLKCSNKWKS